MSLTSLPFALPCNMQCFIKPNKSTFFLLLKTKFCQAYTLYLHNRRLCTAKLCFAITLFCSLLDFLICAQTRLLSSLSICFTADTTLCKKQGVLESCCFVSKTTFSKYVFPKKSIQPQVPLQLPCYDFASISSSLLNLDNMHSFYHSVCHSFAVATVVKRPQHTYCTYDLKAICYRTVSCNLHADKILQPGHLSKRDGQEVQSSGTVSPWRADPRLLVIPPSCPRVAEGNPN